MRQVKSCGVLVFSADEQSFLLMRHRNRWDLPKGHIEPEESELDCALRELREETGITAEQINLIDGFRHTETYQVRYKRFGGEKMHKTLVVFLARLVADKRELNITEHVGYEWHPWKPPHCIQSRTIDPLLLAVADHRASG